MHHDFFTLYTNEMPQSVRDLVDKRRNCEDIAMQFMIANVTQLPPIYVKGHLGDLGETLETFFV
jgi:glucuronyl/N-acetylglucosaminyl transferase EXT2